MDDLLSEFLNESREMMDQLDNDLVDLEKNPSDKEILGNIFRVVHTIKGTCGFLSLPRLERVSHAAENVLTSFREGRLDVTQDRISMILEALDRIKMILTALEESEAEPDGDDNDIISRLNSEVNARSKESAAPESAAPPAPPKESTVQDEFSVAGATSQAPPESAPEPPPTEAQNVAAAPAGPTKPDPEAVRAALLAADMAAAGALSSAMAPAPTPAQEEASAGFDEQFDHEDSMPAETSEAMDTMDKEVVEEFASEHYEDMQQAYLAWQAVTGKREEKKRPGVRKRGDQPRGSGGSEQTVRVRVDLLESLMNTVSELVLTRNQLLQLLRQSQDSDFTSSLQRLNVITGELQEGVMKTRMQPIGTVWAKLPRAVRDLSMELGKKIDLVMMGQETEIDRQLTEFIKDPLMHMIRNSADHGIETPAERQKAGKSEGGLVTLNAFHEGGHIIVEVTDDGRGIDPEKIRQKIVERGLANAGEAANLGDNQLFRYIFHPGFSTTGEVSQISGRGVGMDVVKNNVDKLGGVVDLSSVKGRGARFTIKIPLTLAIVSGLIVGVGEGRFALPQISVVELVHASASHDHRIDYVQGQPVLRLRNRLLPLVSLRELLGMESVEDNKKKPRLANGMASSALNGSDAGGSDAGEKSTQTHTEDSAQAEATQEESNEEEHDLESSESSSESSHESSSESSAESAFESSSEAFSESGQAGGSLRASASDKKTHNGHDVLDGQKFIVVTKVGTTSFGMIVDQVYDTEEIVVKPVSSVIKHVPFFSGNTILGDGSVIMILDPSGIAQSVQNLKIGEDLMHVDDDQEDSLGLRMTLLLFRADDGVLKAVPINVVSRLEEIDLSKIEYPNNRPMIQYRNQLMPLINIQGNFEFTVEGRKPVAVFSNGAQSIGLVLEEIIDIIDENFDVQMSSNAPGLIGSTIIRGQATDVIDAAYFWDRVFTEILPAPSTLTSSSSRRARLLLVNSDEFYKDLLVPVLTASGYNVSVSDSVDSAMNMLREGYSFELIISDIDRDSQRTFEFVNTLRSTTSWSSVPIIGISSGKDESIVEKGYVAGFSDMVAKNDRAALIRVLDLHRVTH